HVERDVGEHVDRAATAAEPHRQIADTDHVELHSTCLRSEGGCAPLPNLPPSQDCAGRAGARSGNSWAVASAIAPVGNVVAGRRVVAVAVALLVAVVVAAVPLPLGVIVAAAGGADQRVIVAFGDSLTAGYGVTPE